MSYPKYRIIPFWNGQPCWKIEQQGPYDTWFCVYGNDGKDGIYYSPEECERVINWRIIEQNKKERHLSIPKRIYPPEEV